MWCNYCDPKFFVIYGFCRNCNRRCEPPPFDPIGDVSLKDWLEMRINWNAERADLILDAMRRTEDQEDQ
jgi:hypothetical protein